MAGMFGQRQMGGSQLRAPLSEQLMYGAGPQQMMLQQQGPQRTMFGGAPQVPSPAAMMNSQNLDLMGARQFQGNQFELDRDLSRFLQQRQLRNNVDLANIDQGTQFGVQDRRNSGALDQINASGGWERTIQGDRLSSAEQMAAAARALDEMQMRGGWEQQGLDRGSREKLGFAELENALERQRLSNSGALDQIGAEGGIRMNLQQMVGDQGMRLQGLQDKNAFERTRYVEDSAGGRLGMELRNRSELTDREIAGRLQQTGIMEGGMDRRLGRELTSREKVSFADLEAKAQALRAGREDRQADRNLTREEMDRRYPTKEERVEERDHTRLMRKFDLDQAAVQLAITQANQKIQAARGPAELAKAEAELEAAKAAGANVDLERKRIESEIALTGAQTKKFNTDAMTVGETYQDAAGNPAAARQLGMSDYESVVGAISNNREPPVEAIGNLIDAAIDTHSGGKLDFGMPGRSTPLWGSKSKEATEAVIKSLEARYNIKVPTSWRPFIKGQMEERGY